METVQIPKLMDATKLAKGVPTLPLSPLPFPLYSLYSHKKHQCFDSETREHAKRMLQENNQKEIGKSRNGSSTSKR